MLIAGTGRAGTSFLVRYLCELGLDTEIARSGLAQWHEQANAGYETNPITTPADELPYVIKSPWTHEFIEQLLARANLTLDVVIIPVRDLVEAAASRVILQMRAMYDGPPQMGNFERMWESWGTTPGGVVFSLNPLDQARILAVGFHRLVQRLIEADVPIVFLAFPKLLTDCGYLFAKLRPFLPRSITFELARAAHQALAELEKARVGSELSSARSLSEAKLQSTIIDALTHPDFEQLDHIAVRRELKRITAERDALARSQRELIAEHDALARSQRELIAERDALARSQSELIAERDALARSQSELIAARDALRREHNALLASSSWRLTAPLRMLKRLLLRH
jgi:hypothetical protein